MSTIQEGEIIYRNDGHLTVQGSAYLGRKFHWPNGVRTKANY